MLWMRLPALRPLAEPGLAEAAPPRGLLGEVEPAGGTSIAGHRDRWSGPDWLIVVSRALGATHELRVGLILSQLPFMRVVPTLRPWFVIGALITVVSPEPLECLIERHSVSRVLV